MNSPVDGMYGAGHAEKDTQHIVNFRSGGFFSSTLETSPIKIRALIGLQSYFYFTIGL